MGRAKALLEWEGRTLAEAQLATLEAAGCGAVRVVTGAHDAEIRAVVGPARCIFNGRWAEGRMTSVQAGMRGLPGASGWLFLPVDAVGVKPETLRAVLEAAVREPGVAWRPCYGGKAGHALWIPSSLAGEVLSLGAEARLDEWAEGRAKRLECGDEGLLRNANTPEEWRAAAWGSEK